MPFQLKGNMARSNYTDKEFLEKTYARTEEVYTSLDTPCWLWTGGSMTIEGYVNCARNRNGVRESGNRHRQVYEADNGVTLPQDLHVDHLCGHTGDTRSRRCMNPAHMRVTSCRENVRCSPKTKMSPAKVTELRELYATRDYTQRELGSRYGISQGLVSRIANKMSWEDI